MRTAFIKELLESARKDPRIFLVVGDLGYSVVEPFAREFPDRFLNAGVAEQNMTGLAAGLASEGYRPFTYSIANFPTFRCAEQIRNDVAYHDLPVTVVAVGGGMAYGSLGYSHHAVQDLALMRTFPNMVIAAPGDPAETRACMRRLAERSGPSYLRLGKAGEPAVHASDVDLALNRLTHVHSRALGTRAKGLLLTTGATLKMAHDAMLDGGVDEWDLCSLPLWSEDGKAALAKELAGYRAIITVEDHLRAGGFGSYIGEAIDDYAVPVSLRCLALSPVVCGEVAGQASLNKKGGVSVDSIVAALRATGLG